MTVVLVIDDDAALRKMVGRILAMASYGVLEAENGEIGVALAAEKRPALVITDIYMPRKEGIETIRALRQHDPKIKIIAMSGGGLAQNTRFLRAACELGADAALEKPFRAVELLQAVHKLLAERGADQ
jgi:CheY-like chemotaxis protein